MVQKLLCHASPNMTGHYAKVHDATVREAFDRYQSQRVNIAGERVGYDADSPTASAEWVEAEPEPGARQPPQRLLRPPRPAGMPHRNACLTCPDFQTTPEFLEAHRRQAATNRRLIAQADARGQFRLVENLHHVQANLERIIPALERIDDREARAMAADSLAKANARRHQLALLAAQHAIDQLCREGKAVNFGSVSRAAGVSRAWLYRQADVREEHRPSPLLGAASAAGGRTTGEPQLAPSTPGDRPGRDKPPESREQRATRPTRQAIGSSPGSANGLLSAQRRGHVYAERNLLLAGFLP